MRQIGRISLICLCFSSMILTRRAFGFFFVRMNLQRKLHVFFVGGGFHHAADGGGGEAIATNQQCHIGGGEDQAEAQPIGPELGDAELSLIGMLDQLHSVVL